MMADDGRVIPFRHVKGFATILLVLIAILFLASAVLGWQLVIEKKRHRRTLAQLVAANRHVAHYKSELESDVTALELAQAGIEEALSEKTALPTIQKIEPKGNAPTPQTVDERRDILSEENIQEKEESASSGTPFAEEAQSENVSQKIAPVEEESESLPVSSPPLQPSETEKQTTAEAVEKTVPDEQVSEKPVSEEDLYESSMKKFRNGDYDGARNGFEKLIATYPKSSRADNARFWIGECYYREKLYDKAIIEYRKVIDNYPSGNKVPGALLKQGFSCIEMGKTETARRLFNELIAGYPQTDEAKIARKKLKTL